MKPLDPRLLRYARATRAYLVLTVVIGVAVTALLIAQAWLIAEAVSGSFIRRDGLSELRGALLALLAVVLGRAVLAWLTESAAHRASAKAKSQLRAALLAKVVEVGPRGLGGRRTSDLTTLATRGVDALDGYFARYLPQLVLAVIVPAVVIVVLATQDWVSALIIVVVIPLIPVFMVLIGIATREHTDKQLSTLQLLAGHFLDVVGGLPTLKVFGRAKVQTEVIASVSERYRRATMSTLRLAFTSSLVLELLGTLSVALVAVSVGLRLLAGEMSFRTALFVLLLVPEALLPLRQVGANFHASAEGLAAAEQVFDVLALPVPPRGSRTDVPSLASHDLRVEGLTVRYDGRAEDALHEISLVLRPGETVALVGPSGAGKSTLLAVLLGFQQATAGRVQVGDVDLVDLDPDAWRSQLSWLPQRPHLFATSIEANIRLGDPSASSDRVWEAVRASGLSEVVDALPAGLATVLGEGGAGLSTGERQRVALARAFLRDAPLLLLDEPTASLDGATEVGVLDAVRRLATDRTVLLVAHRPSLLALADRVVEVELVEPSIRPETVAAGVVPA